jgi:hypothetical protein
MFFTITKLNNNKFELHINNNRANANKNVLQRSVIKMSKSNNKSVVPEAREALNKFKMEAASEVGVDLKQGYNGHLTSREAGSVGGQMVKKMIESYEKNMK